MVISCGGQSFALKKEMETEESEAIMAEQNASEFQMEKYPISMNEARMYQIAVKRKMNSRFSRRR